MPYQHGAGPVRPANGSDLNGLIRLGTVDLFEDYKISGGIRIAPNLRDNDVLFEFMNLKKRWDWGFTYYRSTTKVEFEQDPTNPSSFIPPRKVFATYYLARLNYAFDRVQGMTEQPSLLHSA
jgi:hypothetical protein